MSQPSDEVQEENRERPAIAERFRGFLPVVIDVETGGFICETDALLEIAAVMLELRPDGHLGLGKTVRYHVKPFPGARLDPASLEVTGIDPFHPLRPALEETDVTIVARVEGQFVIRPALEDLVAKGARLDAIACTQQTVAINLSVQFAIGG